MDNLVALEALVARIPDGASLVVPADRSGVALAATAALIERAPKNLHLICAPVSGMQADMLIGAGCVGLLETSAVTLGEAGAAPRFVAGVREGAFQLRDATCPAILAGLVAAQKGVPFQPIRGLIGSDLMKARPDWKVIDNPFEPGDPIVVVPAIKPDFALFHAPEADRFGNVRIGRQAELAAMAYAAKATLVTVERIVETSLLANEREVAGVLPELYVEAIALAPRGAWPLGLWGEYRTDDAEIARYAEMARTTEGFETYLASFAGALEAVA
jgi:glutaconate CoA-transferase, subunit A